MNKNEYNKGIDENKIDTVMGNWNDSTQWNCMWANTNVGEALPEVMTPSTWFWWNTFQNETQTVKLPDNYPIVGIIGGRSYSNFSLIYSIYKLMMNPKKALEAIEEGLGKVPDNIEIPEISLSKLSLIKMFATNIARKFKYLKIKKEIPEYIASTPAWCAEEKTKIESINSNDELLALWQNEIKPYLYKSFYIWRIAMGQYSAPAIKLNKELRNLIEGKEANALLSNVNEAELESLRPVIGLSMVAKGEMTKNEYISNFGHRSPNELELFEPRPFEDKDWINNRIKEFRDNSIDVQKLLEKQRLNYESALKRFNNKYPRKINMEKKLLKVSKRRCVRESVRSEVTRVIDVLRKYYLKAGVLSAIDNDIFFLSYDEVQQLLKGDKNALEFVSIRRKKYEEYKELPDYPTFIIGNFDPFVWAKDPSKHSDYYIDNVKKYNKNTNKNIKGFAGASGKVEGVVRVISSPEEWHNLKKGEILVTSKINVGWSILFPLTSAIITDVGAPLSHAAIVARELGIPAVVGCRDATERLKTGDRVRVNGDCGIIKIID